MRSKDKGVNTQTGLLKRETWRLMEGSHFVVRCQGIQKKMNREKWSSEIYHNFHNVDFKRKKYNKRWNLQKRMEGKRGGGVNEGVVSWSRRAGLGSHCVANREQCSRPPVCLVGSGCYHAHFVLGDDSFIQGDMHSALQGQSAPAPTSSFSLSVCCSPFKPNLSSFSDTL